MSEAAACAACTELRRDLDQMRHIWAACLRPLRPEDAAAASAALSVMGARPMLAAEIRARVSRAPGASGAAAREALAAYVDDDGGHRRLGRLLFRCRGRPIGGRIILVHDYGGRAGYWYSARGIEAEKPIEPPIR